MSVQNRKDKVFEMKHKAKSTKVENALPQRCETFKGYGGYLCTSEAFAHETFLEYVKYKSCWRVCAYNQLFVMNTQHASWIAETNICERE